MNKDTFFYRCNNDKSLADLSRVKYWVFDLDNTLYPAHCNLFLQVSSRMTEFICNSLNLTYDEAKDLQKKYFEEYGTTLNGLMMHDKIDPHAFLQYVHDIDYSLLPNMSLLNEMLHKLPATKIIFTNGSQNHAQSVTDRLGITHHFDHVFDIVKADFMPKPQSEPYDLMLAEIGIPPDEAVMVEDIAKNLHYPKKVNMQTVWIETDDVWAQDGHDKDIVDFETNDITKFLHEVIKNNHS